jgi:hypothetical protein
MNDTKTYVLCRRQEAADALAAVAPSIGQGVKYVIVALSESFDRTAQRLRAEDETARIIFVVEHGDTDPAVELGHSSVLYPPESQRFSYDDAMTSDLAALAYAEAFRNAVSATECNTSENY